MLFAFEMFDGLRPYGYIGIILYMILTGCGLPTPEEVAIIFGGVASATGDLHWGLTLGSLLIGAIVGDCVMYGIGFFFGHKLLGKNRLWNRLITPEREKKVERLLAKHGVKVLLVARFLPGIRGPMYITAGILKVPFRRFLLADLFCATLVVTLFFGLSYFFGGQVVRAIKEGEGWLTTIVLAVAVIVGGGFLLYYLRRKRLEPNTVIGDITIASESNAVAPTSENGHPIDAEEPVSSAEPPDKVGA